MHDGFQWLAVGGHDGSFLVVDRVARSDCIVGIRGPDGEVLSVYLTNVDIEKLVEFLVRRSILPSRPPLRPARHTDLERRCAFPPAR
jgi:hypothetical protein